MEDCSLFSSVHTSISQRKVDSLVGNIFEDLSVLENGTVGNIYRSTFCEIFAPKSSGCFVLCYLSTAMLNTLNTVCSAVTFSSFF